MRKSVVIAVATCVLTASVAFAGESSKCTLSTQECLNEMAAKMKRSGWIGVMLEREKDGLLHVTEVVAGSPAQRAGIQPGDTLYAMNGIPLIVGNESKIQKARADLKPGSSITYNVRRDGGSRDLTMTLAPMPTDIMAKYIGAHMLEHAAQDLAAAKDGKGK